MDTEVLIAGFLAAAVRVATPLLLGATGARTFEVSPRSKPTRKGS